MKLFNPIYLAAIVVAFFLWKFSLNFKQESVLFYGFAENKETEINLDHPVEVNKILISPGQFVKQGELLLEVSHVEYEHDISQELNEIEGLKIKEQLWKKNKEADIKLLNSEHLAKVQKIDSEIQETLKEKKYQESLFEGLENIDNEKRKIIYDPLNEKIKSLEDEKRQISAVHKTALSNLQNALNSSANPFRKEIEGKNAEISLKQNKLNKLSVSAPSDGLIGNVHCKEAENISSFKTLISFYEPNPSQVKGFLHEELIVEVNVNDTLIVRSLNQVDLKYIGVVKGLGSRIVEIPERMRRIPEIKTYGREVLIEIPLHNKLLQKEKVVIELRSDDTASILGMNDHSKMANKNPKSD